MTIYQRRIFMLFFMFLFVIIAPTIVFFAKGYRFDTKSGIFVYSGSITMKSVPRDIKVFLNDKQQTERRLNYINNAYTINGVRPGRYSLRCEKEGYTSWEKDIEVHSGISTEFWNILLLPKQETQDILVHTDKNVKQFFLSPRDNQEVIFFSEEDDKRIVYLLNTANNNIDKIFETNEFFFLDSSEKENVEWSSDNKRIFIPFQDKEGSKNYIIARIRNEEIEEPINLNEIFNKQKTTDSAIKPREEAEINESSDTEKGKVIVLNEKTENNIIESKDETEKIIEKVRWMFDKNEELVILTKDNKLYYIDINNPEEKILIDKQVSGFDFAGNRIYYTQLPNNLVWEIKNNDIETKRQITSQSFPSSEKVLMELTVYDEYRLTIRNNENGDLLIFNEEKEKNEILIKTVNKNIEGVQFSNDGKKILYWSDFEIWFLMLRDWDVQPIRKKGDGQIITRFSMPIKNIQWLDNYENIIFSAGNKIKSAEIDVRDHINIVDVLESSQEFEDRDFFYNKKNQTLFMKTPEDKNNIKTIKSTILLDAPGIFGLGR